MGENKPKVIPTKQDKKEAEEMAKILAFNEAKKEATQEIYTNSIIPEDTPNKHVDAVEAMRRRTEEQIRLKEEKGIVQDLSLAETPIVKQLSRQEEENLAIRKKAEEQIKLRDERLAYNNNLIQNYQKQTEEFSQKNKPIEIEKKIPMSEPKKDINEPVGEYGKNNSNINPYILELSQPNYNSPFDVIPLPSEGKLNRLKKSSVKVSFMTTADENILTSPNLIKSGEFLSILLNRKILEPTLRYNDLHVGDRNAIMIWLRATGYGEMYPVTLLDENDVPFETEINLFDLKIKNLGAEPDEEGLFDFTFPLSKNEIKFKLLTCGDVDEIEIKVEAEKEIGNPVNNYSTYMLEKSIVELNGNRDKNLIREFSKTIRIRDAKSFSEYIEKIESGVDLNIEVRTPGGGSVNTFLPLNFGFFWPNFRV